MNRGLLLKTWHETWAMTLIYGIGAALIEGFLAGILPTFAEDAFGPIMQIPFVKNMLTALLGVEIGDMIGPQTAMGIAWVHPLILVVVTAHLTTWTTRVPAGEVDRGTVDFLFAFPVSRFSIYAAESLGFLASGMFLVMMAVVGQSIGLASAPETFPIAPAVLTKVLSNLFALYAAIGGIGFLVSSFSNHRGRAVGTILGIVLASFLINFLAQFWTPAKHLAWLSCLSYYQPVIIIRDQTWPWDNLTALGVVAVAAWGMGAAVFVRRDVCTV